MCALNHILLVLMGVFCGYMHGQKGIAKTPKCIRSTRNQRAMVGIVEAPSFLDIAIWPMEEVARLIGNKVLPAITDVREAVHDTVLEVIRTGSAIVELAKRE